VSSPAVACSARVLIHEKGSQNNYPTKVGYQRTGVFLLMAVLFATLRSGDARRSPAVAIVLLFAQRPMLPAPA
jgi:hypothetical protein